MTVEAPGQGEAAGVGTGSHLLAAWHFLTRVPLPGRHRATVTELGPCLAYFPLVGLALGAALAGADRLLGLALPPALQSALVLVLLIGLTGALHLEGLIDACDGVFYPGTPERRLEIMSDSRRGSFAIAGGAAMILLKFAALLSIPAASRAATIMAAPALGRWAMAWAVIAHPTAKQTGMAAALKQTARRRHLATASVFALLAAGLLLGLGGLAAAAGVWLVGAAAAAYFRSRLGGLTGDTYGAINELCEVAALIMAPPMVNLVGGGLLGS